MTVYFDHNATTPLRPEARAAMLPFLGESFGNAASVHGRGQRAAMAVDRARHEIRVLASGPSGDVVFTGSGTEAVIVALVGAGRARARAGAGRHLVVSALEHAASVAAEAILEREGWTVTRVAPRGALGRIAVEDLERALRPDTALVSLMHANNETGVLQPVVEVAALCRERGILFHTDAAQSAGKVPIAAEAWGVDLVSLAAHKVGGPQGMGAVWKRRGLSIEPFIPGSQEAGLRGGTVNVAGAVGFGAAARSAARDLDRAASASARLRERLETLMIRRVPAARVTGAESPRLPNTAHFTFEESAGPDLVPALDLAGFAVSAGSACASGSPAPSRVLLAMGFSEARARTAVRASLGADNTEAEVEAFVEACERILRAAAARSAR